MSKRRKSVRVKVSRKKSAGAAAPAALRPFLFVSGRKRKGSKRRGSFLGGFMAKRKGRKSGGGGMSGKVSSVSSFFGKPVLYTVVGASLASAFGPKVRGWLPASMQTPGSLVADAIIAFGGGYLIARFVNREAGAGWAAGALGASLGGMIGNVGGQKATAQGMRGLPGESTGVSYLPEMAGMNDDEMSGYGDDDAMSGFDSDALEV